MKGRRPKTTQEHIENGTYQPVRHAGRLEAPALTAIPAPPLGFDDEHAAKWREVCRHLLDFNILAQQDTDAIRSYVESHITANRAYLTLLAIGFHMETEKGPRLHPLWRVYQDARKMEKALYDQFAFTPRARMGLKVGPKEKPPEDPFAEAIKAMNKTALPNA